MISELKTCTSGGLVFPVAMFRPDDTLVMNSRPRAAVLYFPEDVADEAAIEKLGTFFMSVGYQMFAVLASIRPGEELAVAASAAAFIRRNAAEFGTDPGLIVTLGYGKAALPAALLALARGHIDPAYGDSTVAGAIVDKQMSEAIGAEFGVDVKEINAETQKREEAKRREKEKADREAKEKAQREEREKKQAEEKRREEHEKSEREERERKELDERQKTLSSLPKSVEGWKRGVGENNEVYVECLFSDGGNSDRSMFPPVQIRVTPKGDYAYVQPSPDGSMCSVVIFRDDSQSDREPACSAYLALVGAAEKAKAWRKTASERGEDEFVKEIPTTNAPNCSFGVLADNGENSSGGEGKVRFWFEVHKLEGVAVRDRKDQSVGSWFRGLTKDMNHVYCIRIGSTSTAILVNLDSIDGFLKAVNPIGAFEALRKFNDLYK